ncbi:MAG TPA: serine/threonine-protein kinase [Kofleriaceae bacterium]|nr:serine/threonine-protein kinase [Kofleriaceae bacterium]
MTAKFGNYEILYELKSGGMGAVLLARRRGPGTFEQLVAIKTIRPEYAQAPAVRAMFLDEAAILARLNHPGIATVHDFGEQGGTLYMVMEYVAGLPLRDVGTHVIPPAVLARAIAEAARGLHAAHEARDPSGALMGLVHRDISPDNLMLGYDGHIKVIDFGIALVKNRQAPVTEFGTVKGKPPYMSPEQVKNEAMDRRSDVWALGVVAWEMLTGHGLFDGDSIYAIALAVEQQAIVPPSQGLPPGRALPIGLDAAVMGALQRDLAARTPNAAALADQLEQVVQAAGGETLAAWAARELEAERAKHREWLAGVVGATAAASVGADPPKSLPRAVSRPTDQPTQVGPVAAAAIADQVAVVPPPGAIVEPSPGTSLGGAGEGDELVAPVRNRTPLVILAIALLLAGAVVFVATRSHDTAKVIATRDAAASHGDAALIVQLGPLDAEPDAPAIADAAIPIDAGRTVARHRDAGVVAVKPDAAAMAVVPTGTGVITIRAAEGSNTITIDDGAPLTPPVNHRTLAAGSHTIKFYDGKTSALLDTQKIELHDREQRTVVQRH